MRNHYLVNTNDFLKDYPILDLLLFKSKRVKRFLIEGEHNFSQVLVTRNPLGSNVRKTNVRIITLVRCIAKRNKNPEQ